jgi:hypothetical protein
MTWSQRLKRVFNAAVQPVWLIQGSIPNADFSQLGEAGRPAHIIL